MSGIPPDDGDRSPSAAERALLSLQSKTIEALTQSVLTRHLVTQQMKGYLARLKLDVDQLPVIHVAGTKGKGSTSAFTERICRAHGMRTGLYSSPHLVHINERFRLDGVPVSDQVFHKHFWAVWDGLRSTVHEAGSDPPIPSYFRFLTLVAFHIFLHQSPRLDVIVLEVGMGGKLDATNIITTPYVCGIASIGFDHMEVLGYSLREIASEKAGIIKPSVPVFSVQNQADDVKKVFEEVAASEGAPLAYARPLPSHIELGLAGFHQYENAGLACALAWEFLRKSATLHPNDHRFQAYVSTSLDPTHLPDIFLDALKCTSWPGRCQQLPHTSDKLRDRVQFYIDGAHTDASMRIACEWFQTMQRKEQAQIARKRVLLFNCGHVRDPIELMIPLVAVGFPAAATARAGEPTSHELVSPSTSASIAPLSTSPLSASSPNLNSPLSFSHLVCTPFDHDRPHFSSAPTFEKLLQNYALLLDRKSNASVAANKSAASSSAAASASSSASPAAASAASTDGILSIRNNMHPIVMRFLVQHFDFPADASTWKEEIILAQAKASLQAVAQRYASVSSSEFAAMSSEAGATVAPTVSVNAPKNNWQRTLFQVWQFLSEAFEAAGKPETTPYSLPSVPSCAEHSCIFAPSVHVALSGIEEMARVQSKDSFSVFVTGSLYLVGNVLQRLDYRV